MNAKTRYFNVIQLFLCTHSKTRIFANWETYLYAGLPSDDHITIGYTSGNRFKHQSFHATS